MEEQKGQVNWPTCVQNIAILATLVAIVWAVCWTIVRIGGQ